MNISIAQRFHPFSHQNGAKFLLPKSCFSAQVFPTRVYVLDIEKKAESFFLSFDFSGPLTEFTVELNLEEGFLRVFGMTKKGYMRYRIFVKEEGLWLMIEKIPEETLRCRHSSFLEEIVLKKGEIRQIAQNLEKGVFSKNQERLSLGIHKAQDWEFIRSRLDFRELFPLWLALSHWIPVRDQESREGNYRFIQECCQIIERGEKQKILSSFKNLFLAAFEGVLVPRLLDTEYQGILPEVSLVSPFASPLPLVTQGARWIRSLFILSEENCLSLLPCLPPEFHSGRMVGVQPIKDVILDMEWSKKRLRRVELMPSKAKNLLLKFPKALRSCRVKKGRKEMKTLFLEQGNTLTLSLLPNEKVKMDRFQE